MEYELLFFTSLANEERIPEIKREIEEIIIGRGGKISADFSDIGKRKFAHPIKKQTHGFFSFCRFTLEEKENLTEINRRMVLNDKVMRHLIVRADEIGKPMSEQKVREEKPEEKVNKKTEARPKEPAVAPETKPKVEISDLDEKLTEILEENPE
ncbi:MAG: 30S ribosomal protein S6 [Candidatus Moranbacteria bacterium]|nr:30S ribosomal protein S6 [Candidatus Moranbacteria bacterium]